MGTVEETAETWNMELLCVHIHNLTDLGGSSRSSNQKS